jgi:hypothetical protein
MLRYEYENAIVYVSKVTEKHLANIREATEVFMRKVVKERIQNENRRSDKRVNLDDNDTRKGDTRA